MVEIITAEIIKAVGGTVAEYVFGKVGDKFYETRLASYKIKNILKADKKYIEQQFERNELETLHVEEFLFQEIFQDSIFLYPVSAIPKDRVKLLWGKYRAYMTDKHNIDINTVNENEDIIKSKLGKCVNNHNELVNKHLLSENDRIILKTMQRSQSDLLGYIGQTLDANSELQSTHAKLDYTHKQVEGILHAFRMDMRHYKLLLMLNLIGIIVFAIISIIVSPQIIGNLSDLLLEYSDLNTLNSILFISLVVVLAFVLLILIWLFFISLRNVQKCENRIVQYMESLWEIHFSNYKRRFDLLFETDEVTTDN